MNFDECAAELGGALGIQTLAGHGLAEENVSSAFVGSARLHFSQTERKAALCFCNLVVADSGLSCLQFNFCGGALPRLA